MRTIGLFVVLGLSWSALAFAQEPPTSPGENPAARQATDLAVKKGLEWITRQQCMKCHFNVPKQPAAASAAIDADLTKVFAADKNGKVRIWSAATGKLLEPDPCTRSVDIKEKVTYLGVTLTVVPPVVRRHVKLPDQMGLLVESVDGGSPAQKAGLAQHDLLLKIDEQLLVNPEQFTVLIRTFNPGENVRLTVVQQNEQRVLKARLAQREVAAATDSRQIDGLANTLLGHHLAANDAHAYARMLSTIDDTPTPKDPPVEPPPPRKKAITYLGVHTSSPSEALGKQLKLFPGLGLMIDSVEENSAADKAGLAPFDVLQRLDDQLLVNEEQFTALIRSKKPGDVVKLTLIREGKTEVSSATLGQHEIEVAASEAVENVLGNWIVEARDFHWHRDRPDNARWWVDLQKGGRYDSATDAEFIRRVYLDLMGIVPRAEEVKSFLADTGKDKRKKLIDELRSRPEAISRASGATAVQWNDAAHSLTLTSKEGLWHLLAKSAEGKSLFDGPVDTAKEREALPAELGEKLGVMLNSQADHQSRPTASAQEALERVLPKVDLADVPLKQAFEKLRGETGVNLVVNWKALKQAGVNADEPVTLTLRDVRFSTALTTLLSLAGDEKARLGYTVDGEVILVTVKGK